MVSDFVFNFDFCDFCISLRVCIWPCIVGACKVNSVCCLARVLVPSGRKDLLSISLVMRTFSFLMLNLKYLFLNLWSWVISSIIVIHFFNSSLYLKLSFLFLFEYYLDILIRILFSQTCFKTMDYKIQNIPFLF